MLCINKTLTFAPYFSVYMTPTTKSELYFFALLLPFNLQGEVDEIKMEFADKYESHKALKSPPHITIVPPFFANEQLIAAIDHKVSQFVNNFESFEIKLNGFGQFKDKVIFIDVEKSQSLQLFYTAFLAFFTGLGFELTTMNKFIHPHVTVAFRDLSEVNFQKAWPLFKDRKFSEKFSASSLHLLNQTGEEWKAVNEFRFRT